MKKRRESDSMNKIEQSSQDGKEKEKRPSQRIVDLTRSNDLATSTSRGLAGLTVLNNASLLKLKKTTRIARAIFTKPLKAIKREVMTEQPGVAIRAVNNAIGRRELEVNNRKITQTSRSNALERVP